MLVAGACSNLTPAVGGALPFAVDYSPSTAYWGFGSALSYHISIVYYINSQYRIANFNTLHVPYTGQ